MCDGAGHGGEDEVLLLVPVTVSKDVSAGGDAAIRADVSWLVCQETCVKGKAKLSLSDLAGLHRALA